MRRRTGGDATGLVVTVFGVLLVAVLLTVAGYYAKDRLIDRPAATARAKALWPGAQAAVAARLKQQDPLEFGEVWATHEGLICGMVNGRGSFSGLIGMTPFYVDGGKATFALDETAMDFADHWRLCSRDNWAVVLPGSPQAGFCATKAGQKRCATYG